jgi:hypothetical protein
MNMVVYLVMFLNVFALLITPYLYFLVYWSMLSHYDVVVVYLFIFTVGVLSSLLNFMDSQATCCIPLSC